MNTFGIDGGRIWSVVSKKNDDKNFWHGVQMTKGKFCARRIKCLEMSQTGR